MFKKIFLIIIILSLTGCYDYKELNTISLVSATEITKENNLFVVSNEIINTEDSNKSNKNSSPYIIYTGKGKTIQEAYREITLSSSRYLYSNHLQLLIIDESLAKEDITSIVDFYLRNPGVRTEFYVLIGKKDNILSITSPIDTISSTSIKKTIDTNKKYNGNIYPITFSEFVNMITNPNLELILPSITVNNNITEEDTKEDNIKKTEIDTYYLLEGYAIFKNNILLDYLSTEESKYYNLITNKIDNTIYVYPCNNNEYITLEIINSTSNIKNNKNKIDITLSIDSNIKETSCPIKLNNNKELSKLKKDIENKLNNDLQEFINNIITKYNTDIFSFKDLIYKKDYSYYQTLDSNYLSNLDISISSNINIISKGNILEALNEKNN